MSITIITTLITRKYLMSKTKSELAYMYLDLLEMRVKDEAALKLCKEWMDSPLPADINEQIAKENYLREAVDGALGNNVSIG